MKKFRAFTLAEVLITLAIIGVVSALVIPSVLKNYNDKKYNTARLKALKTFGEAGKLASINGEINGQPTARAFVENVLSKYLKIVKICDNNKASECNFAKTITASNPTKTFTSDNLKTWNNIGKGGTYKNWSDLTNTNFSVYITTNDGFSAKLFYNPKCVRNSRENPYESNGKCQSKSKECSTVTTDDVCVNVIYDMNGNKAPNQVGKDIGFVTTFWSGLNAASYAPGFVPYEINSLQPYKTNQEAISYCASLSTKSANYYLPTVNELSSLILNMYLASMPNDAFWATPSSGIVWRVYNGGAREGRGAGEKYIPWCVHR